MQCSIQLSYEATGVGSRSIIIILSSHVPVKEMNVNYVYEIKFIYMYYLIIHTLSLEHMNPELTGPQRQWLLEWLELLTGIARSQVQTPLKS